jgi:hypothetical protein
LSLLSASFCDHHDRDLVHDVCRLDGHYVFGHLL